MTVLRLSRHNLVANLIIFLICVALCSSGIHNGIYALTSAFFPYSISSTEDLPFALYDVLVIDDIEKTYRVNELFEKEATRKLLKDLNANKNNRFTPSLYEDTLRMNARQRFHVQLDEIYETGITRSVTIQSSVYFYSQEYEVERIVLVACGDLYLMANVPASFEFDGREKLTGYFVPIDYSAMEYMPDFFPSEWALPNFVVFQFQLSPEIIFRVFRDILFALATTIGLGIYCYRLTMQMIKRERRYIYRQLHFWNFTEQDVNKMLASAIKSKRVYYMSDMGGWKICPGLLRTKLTTHFGSR